MIRIENVETYGWEAAIRGMRNPMNSWEKSDSKYSVVLCWDDEGTTPMEPCAFLIGDNDLELMQKLVAAGTDHGKFMRMITVTMDVVAPLYWWKEFDTYKVGTVADSCSTMHKIHAKEFTVNDFSHDHLNRKSLYILNGAIQYLNGVREAFLKTKDKDYWWQMIQLLPSSYNQRRTVQANYQVLRSMYHARKNHKLDEWRNFCEWVEGLPYADELICN